MLGVLRLPGFGVHELLTPDEMGKADRLAIEAGPLDGYGLMLRAGDAIAGESLKAFGDAAHVHVLCGPGNNGGDGYVVARLLHESGVAVSLWRDGAPKDRTDAARAAGDCPVTARALADFACTADALVVDALFGAGLSKQVTDVYARALETAAHSGARVVAVDLPSGISGANGEVLGTALRADVTVTFFRLKPGHLLQPGRAHCGETIVADIGIRDDVLGVIGPKLFRNDPALWKDALPRPSVDTHKYRRGHVGVFSGGPSATGAARLAAEAALRGGAGAVTVLSPAEALLVNAAHLTAIMLRRTDDVAELESFLSERRPSAFVLGPGFGVGEKAQDFALSVLAIGKGVSGVVLDADGITSFREEPDALFNAAAGEGAPALVLTPHPGEFARLFPDLADDGSLSRIGKARAAAESAHAVVILKGPDTVVAAPDGRAVVNANGSSWLATAGSGDVLAGLVAGLVGQGMPPYKAACASVWLHGEAANAFGAGLTAEDLPGLLPRVLGALLTG